MIEVIITKSRFVGQDFPLYIDNKQPALVDVLAHFRYFAI